MQALLEQHEAKIHAFRDQFNHEPAVAPQTVILDDGPTEKWRAKPRYRLRGTNNSQADVLIGDSEDELTSQMKQMTLRERTKEIQDRKMKEPQATDAFFKASRKHDWGAFR